MSRITRGEISYNIVHKWGVDHSAEFNAKVATLPISVVSVDDALVDEAAALKSKYPISYADCFVAALAIRHKAPVITGDPDFQRLSGLGVLTIHWLGA